MTPREAFTIVDRCAREKEIDQLLLELLRYPSPQTDRLESDPQVKKFIVELVAPRLAELTGSSGAIDAMGNLIWRLGDASTGGFLLMGYAMTFPAASMKEPFSGARVDGRAFGVAGQCALGRGACEQKGALAAMIYAAGIVARAQLALRAPLILAVSLAGETGRHDAAKFMLENDEISARSAIIGLGTSNQICLGNKGRIDIEIAVRGKSAHSSMPWKGVNAVDGFRRVMERLDRVPLGTGRHGLGNATLTVTQVRSGPDISHTIPDFCHVVLDRRLLPGEDPDAAFRDIQDALKEVAGFTVEATRGAVMYPSEVAKGSALAVTAAAASRELTNRDAEFFYSPAALDAGFLNRNGIETIMFGPGDLRFAHTDQEAVALEEVRDAAKIYAATALQIIG
ncbi:MAG: M20/M25/M40 family metallo-hydrolase [Deltaproteobacteria bacterium]|nr:M20/M25/M40 family metallo-hydrolase [Deltaproteobacteria bacterium]MBI2533760.1 M20/M25/M40 family metallo-hydrolase [Deltaproteobacteria bacterium]